MHRESNGSGINLNIGPPPHAPHRRLLKNLCNGRGRPLPIRSLFLLKILIFACICLTKKNANQLLEFSGNSFFFFFKQIKLGMENLAYLATKRRNLCAKK